MELVKESTEKQKKIEFGIPAQFFPEFKDYTHLREAITDHAFSLSSSDPTFRLDGWSGYSQTREDGIRHDFLFAPLMSGGFVIQRRAFEKELLVLNRYDYFGTNGFCLSQSKELDQSLLFVSLAQFEMNCPVVSHLYSTLAHEYAQAESGFACTDRILFCEGVLKLLFESKTEFFTLKAPVLDQSIANELQKMMVREKDQALQYKERLTIRKLILAEAHDMIRVKKRAHHLGLSYTALNRFLFTFFTLKTFFTRPSENFRGLLYRLTIGNFLWFVKTVRGNIGYSVALAIYGPFTFYFITQPMNPHAMWAVGKVRTAFIESIDNVKNTIKSIKGQEQVTDGIVAPTSAQLGFSLPDQKRALQSSKTFPIQNQIAEIDEQSWSDRMSDFKALQIGYEESMQFSARMGRLEQMETQLSFPLIAESAYRELERYNSQIEMFLKNETAAKTVPDTLRTLLENEQKRALDLELYLWDRLFRFMSDHPYVVMDSSKEQRYVDYYFGRSFIFLKELTQKLTTQYKDLKKPKDFKRIEALAKSYSDKKIEDESVEKRISKNAILYGQNDPLDSAQFRSYMKRQWELLFLMQNKAQEASNFGLQTYTWSIRNALWIIQSLYTHKMRELTLLQDFYAGKIQKPVALAEMKNQIEPLYESLIHLAMVEYVSIKQELAFKLPKDIDSIQRERVIDMMHSFVKERDSFLLEFKK